jgi:hypothetical protein
MTGDPTERRTPPESPDEWRYLWRGAQIAHAIGPVILPVAHLVRDWKFWVAAIFAVAWINKPDVIMAIQALAGQ